MKLRILSLFKDDKIFKNPDLLVANLSDKLKSESANVTKLINDEFKTDLSDFANKYRISSCQRINYLKYSPWINFCCNSYGIGFWLCELFYKSR
jgi:hypothetical protein